MDHQKHDPLTHVSIAAVARDTGIAKDTLRVWERRYGFPTPERDSFGERAYPPEQVDKLRIIKRLLDAGQRPGRVVALAMPELQCLSQGLSQDLRSAQPPALADQSAHLQGYMDLIRAHDVEGLRSAMAQAVLRSGVAAFICDVVAPLNAMVGQAWMAGEMEIFEEHLYTEVVATALRLAIHNAHTPAPASPRVLFTTFAQEPHGLGLLMAQTMMALEGCACISLGLQTPILDIALAARAHRADVVALSFTASLNPASVTLGLQELRHKLPAAVQIWAGGQCPVIHHKAIAGVLVVRALADISSVVKHWRASRLLTPLAGQLPRNGSVMDAR